LRAKAARGEIRTPRGVVASVREEHDRRWSILVQRPLLHHPVGSAESHGEIASSRGKSSKTCNSALNVLEAGSELSNANRFSRVGCDSDLRRGWRYLHMLEHAHEERLLRFELRVGHRAARVEQENEIHTRAIAHVEAEVRICRSGWGGWSGASGLRDLGTRNSLAPLELAPERIVPFETFPVSHGGRGNGFHALLRAVRAAPLGARPPDAPLREGAVDVASLHVANLGLNLRPAGRPTLWRLDHHSLPGLRPSAAGPCALVKRRPFSELAVHGAGVPVALLHPRQRRARVARRSGRRDDVAREVARAGAALNVAGSR